MVVVTFPGATVNRPRRGTPLLAMRGDEHLLALFRAGNDDAFAVLFERHRDALHRYVRRMLGDAAEAEDVLQDVFIRGFQTLRGDGRELPVKAWLYRVAHNRAVDHLRRRTPDAADIFEVNRPAALDPHLQTERRDHLRRLVRDVQALPAQQRSALLLRELEGLSHKEIAATLEVTVPAVKSLLVRARTGLLAAQEAEDTACAEVRANLDDSHRRGTRMTGLARRHLLTCGDCRHYHASLRAHGRAVAALDGGGAGPLAWLAQALGFGGAGGAAVAAGSGGAATAGGIGLATGAATKLVAVVATAVVVGGGAVEVTTHLPHERAPRSAASREPAVPAARPALAAPLRLVRQATTATERRIATVRHAAPAPQIAVVRSAQVLPAPPPLPEPPATASPASPVSGGAAAPAALSETAPAAPTPATPTAATTTASGDAAKPATATTPPAGGTVTAAPVSGQSASTEGGSAAPAPR